MEYLWGLYSVRITIEMAGGELISMQFPYLARQLSVRKVVPKVTSKSVEMYLSMAGAKQHNDTGVYPGSGHGPYVQQGCAHGTILRCTVMLVEGSYKQGGRGGGASRSLRVD
jgi:hypothetical protein